MKALPSILRGALGFGAVSVAAFAVWAFAGKWFHARGGEGAMYAAIAAVFVLLTGLVLHPLAAGPRPILRFTRTFVPAFIAYAAVWCAAWFGLRFGWREWPASLAGTAAFAAVAGAMLGNLRPSVKVAAALFVAHSAGYFLGGQVFYSMKTQAGMMLWGLLYGLGFGAGIGYAFHAFQAEP